MRATVSVSDQAHLVKKLRFPVHLLTASALGAALVVQAIGMSLLTVFLLVTGRGSVNFGLLVAAFAFECLLLAGPALVLSSLNVFFRDLAQLLPPFLMIAFYLSPIIYPESMVPASPRPSSRSTRCAISSLFFALRCSGRRYHLSRTSPGGRRARRGRLAGSPVLSAVPPVVRGPSLE